MEDGARGLGREGSKPVGYAERGEERGGASGGEFRKGVCVRVRGKAVQPTITRGAAKKP